MTNVIYANGVASALSNKLLSKDVFVRMSDAKDNVEAFSILQETQFGSGMVVENSFAVDGLIDFETRALLNFVKEESPCEELKSFFLLPYDYKNIANYCKCLLVNENFEKTVDSEGFFDVLFIKDAINSKNFDNFKNRYIKNALEEFYELASKPKVNGSEADFIFKKYLYKNLEDVVKKNKVTASLLKLKIDCENLSVVMRAKTNFQFESQFLEGGEICFQTLNELFEEKKDSIEKIKNPLLVDIAKIVLGEKKDDKFVDFEIKKNNLFISFLKPHKFDNETLYPFAFYLFAKESEIKNVRLIMSYQNNNLKDKIKKRMLECYYG